MYLLQRRFKLLVIFILLFLINIAQSSDRNDGNYWRTMNETQKLKYMVGFIDGMNLGLDFSYWGFFEQNEESHKLAKKVLDSYNEHMDKYFENVTYDQFIDGLDNFYEDYRNRRILINRSVWLIVQSIAGTPKMDKIIENYRQNPGD